MPEPPGYIPADAPSPVLADGVLYQPFDAPSEHPPVEYNVPVDSPKYLVVVPWPNPHIFSL